MPLAFELVTADRVVLQDNAVDAVTAPGTDGELGILPHHVPLITTLSVGELRIRKGREETSIAISGGFMEVTGTKVLILADAAERSDEIDEARAEEARNRAEEALANRRDQVSAAESEAALKRAIVRLRVAQRRRTGARLTINNG